MIGLVSDITMTPVYTLNGWGLYIGSTVGSPMGDGKWLDWYLYDSLGRLSVAARYGNEDQEYSTFEPSIRSADTWVWGEGEEVGRSGLSVWVITAEYMLGHGLRLFRREQAREAIRAEDERLRKEAARAKSE